ncbi:MAG TPA: CoA transferase [Stellaceae bacterium]|jgi:crotonobetainyl-CoA:carnitine CoA-transferase CaiB-like acyl-CoA transferase|nr:CoA transferase [Stellaceae bacterium]
MTAKGTERANRPLAGVVVLDFGQVYQGPYATMLMAKAGADVIKIEPPQGEPLRRRAPPGKSTTFPIAMLNGNKRAITLNLKDMRGRDLLLRMVEKADVLLENFAPGVMDRLGVGWSVVGRINPRLVYASGSGYGLSGPDRDNLAMDLTIQAISGLIATTGFPDGPPVKAGPAVVDFISGIHLYAATITALFEREHTGRGRLVEVAMEEAAYATLTSPLQAYFESGKVPPRTGNSSHGRAPLGVYPTRDGYVALNVAVEEHWHNLLKAMAREELRDDPRFADNAARVAHMAETDAAIGAWTSTLGKMEVFAIAKRYRIPLAPVREVDEVMHDRHMHERGFLADIVHDEIGALTVPNSPLRFHGADPVEATPSPKLGQHNAEIYGGWLGLSADEIGDLKAAGVI